MTFFFATVRLMCFVFRSVLRLANHNENRKIIKKTLEIIVLSGFQADWKKMEKHASENIIIQKVTFHSKYALCGKLSKMFWKLAGNLRNWPDLDSMAQKSGLTGFARV